MVESNPLKNTLIAHFIPFHSCFFSVPPCELALRQVPRSEDLIVDIVGTGGDGQGWAHKNPPFVCLHRLFWAIYSDLSRRLVTPKGSEIPPKWPKHSD